MALKLMWINANPNPNPGGTEAHSVDFIRYLENIKDIELYKVVAKEVLLTNILPIKINTT